ncbi:hypothetical protein [Jatrophihabitans sp.]|uniref:hypothetical protein n=1 Tax=Jatrophihabitans sp. TaxID=1932789 RepID=UPI002F1E2BBA
MSENDDTGTGDLEQAADEGRLPGVEQADAAEEDGRDNSETPDSAAVQAGADDGGDEPAGGVVMGAINQH